MRYSDTLPDNEDEIEDDKTPYASVSNRAPISDPRGRNPAMEEGSTESWHIPQQGPGVANEISQIPNGHSLRFDEGANFGAQFNASRQPNSKILTDVGNQLDGLEDDSQGDPLNNRPLSIPEQMARMIQIRQGMKPPLANAPPLSHFQDEKTWPPTSGKPLDLSEFFPKPDDSTPTPSPSPSPTPNNPGSPPSGPGPVPQNAPSDDNANLPPRTDYAGMMGAPGGDYYLAGVQGAFGANKATGQADLGNSLNRQNAQAMAGIQSDNQNRANVMAAIQNRKAAQTFTAGQNDLNRQNTLAINGANNARSAANNAASNAQSGANNTASNQSRLDAAATRARNNGADKPMTPYQNARLEQVANNNFAQSTQPHVKVFNSINNVTHLLDGLDAGTLKSSPNIANQLAVDMNVINSASSTVSGTDHARIRSLQGDLQSLRSYVQGDVRSTIPPAQLQNLRQELNILRNSTQQSFGSAVKSLTSGTSNPMMQKVYQSRHDSVMNSMGGGDSSPSNTPAPSGNPSGTVMIKNPDTGEVHEVPEDQKDAAIGAGGVLQ